MPSNRTSAVFLARGSRFAHLNDVPEPQTENPQPFPRLALTLLGRRWYVYVLLAAGLSVCDGAANFFLHFRNALYVADSLIGPLFGTIAILVAARDAGYLQEAVTSRFLDRAWAVIVLQFLISLLRDTSQAMLALGGGINAFAGTVVLTFVALMLYSPVDACLREEGAPLTLLPNAIAQSLILSWKRISRAFGMFAIVLCVEMVELLTLIALINRHVRNVEFWANIPFDPCATILIFVIVTAAYIDLTTTKT